MVKRILLFWFLILCQPAYALDSDANQPATLQADDFEIDLNTGVRIYHGNVVFQQGSLQLNCQQLTTYLNDEEQMDKAVCIGNPGRFRQRPQHQNEEMVGTAAEITLNQREQLITLKSGLEIRAQVVQGNLSMSGEIITYNRSTQKLKVTGDGTASANNVDNARPSLVIQPEKKQTVEAE